MEFDKVVEIITEQLGIPSEDITMETSLMKDLDADSLDVFQLVSELEETFEIEFSNEDAEKLKTVGDVVNYIKKLQG